MPSAPWRAVGGGTAAGVILVINPCWGRVVAIGLPPGGVMPMNPGPGWLVAVSVAEVAVAAAVSTIMIGTGEGNAEGMIVVPCGGVAVSISASLVIADCACEGGVSSGDLTENLAV